MPRSPRKPLAYLISATAVSAGLGLAITPAALADDETQPRSPDTGSSQCGNFLSEGASGAGKIAACPLVDPKFNFQPPTEKAAPPAATGNKASDDEGHSDSREARHERHEKRDARNRAAAGDED
jgi:hypothetical protein